MSQKSADKKTHLDSRQTLWDAIREQRTFTVRSVAGRARLGLDTVREYLIGLQKANYIRLTGADYTIQGTPAKIYKLVKDAGVDAPKVRKDGSETIRGRGREQMWTAMRILKVFSPRDLAMHASTGKLGVALAYAKEYCIFLARVGYLVREKDGRFRFKEENFTGPLAPMIQRTKQVYDPNLRRVVWRGIRSGYPPQTDDVETC